MSEWGPWIEHDGKGCPCVGQLVQIVERDHGVSPPRIAGAMFDGTESWSGSGWHWAVIPYGPDGVEWDPIIRYRIRKPRGLTILEQVLSDLPVPLIRESAE